MSLEIPRFGKTTQADLISECNVDGTRCSRCGGIGVLKENDDYDDRDPTDNCGYDD